MIDRLKRAQKEGTTKSLHDEVYFRVRDEVYKTDEKKLIDGAMKKLTFIKRHMPATRSILDCGCGLGYFVKVCRERDIKAQGVDFSRHALDCAPKEVKPYLEEKNIVDIDYPENGFDLVTAFNTCEHLFLNEINQALPKMNKIARKHILIQSPVPIWEAESWVTDFSPYGKASEPHVSVYPWEFWARRIASLNKFQWWFTQLWRNYTEESGLWYQTAEAWITFKRKEE